jgi:mono/diheme cytochrome c family protein
MPARPFYPPILQITAAAVLLNATRTVPATAGEPDVAAVRFVQACSGCHTIGGGAARAPDLALVADWPEPRLVAAIRTMERKVGPLDDDALSGLARLLSDKQARVRVEAARAGSKRATKTESVPMNSQLGGSLFFGLTPLTNGGMPCNSCHRFHGEGGTLGPDLTHSARGVDPEGFASSLVRAGFPVMRGAYKDHPITEHEARNLAAFMQQATSARRAPPDSRITWSGVGLGTVAFFAAVAYVVRRPRGVRARLIQRANKRCP